MKSSVFMDLEFGTAGLLESSVQNFSNMNVYSKEEKQPRGLQVLCSYKGEQNGPRVVRVPYKFPPYMLSLPRKQLSSCKQVRLPCTDS